MDDGFVVLVLLAWIIGTIIAAVIASNRKVSTGLVALLSLFFSPVIGVLVACLMNPKAEAASASIANSTVPAVPEKKCPKCAEMVKKEAVICRFCGYDFAQDIAADEAARIASEEAKRAAEEASKAAWEADAPKRVAQAKKENLRNTAIIVVIVLGFAAVLIVMVKTNKVGSSHTTPDISLGSPPEIPEPTKTDYSNWSKEFETNALDGKTKVVLSKAGFIIRCTSKAKKDSYWTGSSGGYLGDELFFPSDGETVKWKLDGGAIHSQYWSTSDDNHALFFPFNNIKAWQKGKYLVLEFREFEKTSRTVTVDISKLDEAIKGTPCAD